MHTDTSVRDTDKHAHKEKAVVACREKCDGIVTSYINSSVGKERGRIM